MVGTLTTVWCCARSGRHPAARWMVRGKRPDGRRLVGRRDELAQLNQVVDHLESGRAPAQAVEIVGEPGIGKTRLLEELTRLARQRGIEVVTGRATQYERNVPFGMFAEVFSRLTGHAREGTAAQPTIAGFDLDARSVAGISGPEHFQLYRALREMLRGLARAPGCVLILDDLHWADEASLELLENLLHSPPDSFLVTALACRAGQMPVRLAAALSRTRMSTTRISLRRLLPADVARLLPDVTSTRRRVLFEASRGNPLYLDSLAALDDTTVATLNDPAGPGSDDLPDALQGLLTAELAALSDDQRLMAHVLAVAGETPALDLLVRIADRPEIDVTRAIDQLVGIGVVQAGQAGFAFRHPLVRAAAYQSAGPAWRIGAHRRAERYLRECGGPLPVRAHHAAKAAGYGDRAAVTTLLEAAAASLNTAPATAAEWLRAALRILPPDEQWRTRRVESLLMLARALGLSGALAESREILHEVLALPGGHRGVAVRFCAVIERLLGRLDESTALLQAELASTAGFSDDDVGRLVVELAAAQILQNDLVGCRANAGEAIRRARTTGDRGQHAAGEALGALAALHAGHTAEARELTRMAVTLVDGLADGHLREHLHLLPPLAWAEMHLERYADCARHLDRGVDIARGSGRSHSLPYLFVMKSALEIRAGRLERAAEYADEAAEMSRFMGSPETLAMARTMELPGVLRRRGPQATHVLVEQLTADGLPTSRWWAEVAHVLIAGVQLAAREPDACVELIFNRFGSDLTAALPLHVPQLWAMLALAEARRGNLDRAVELVDRALIGARRLDIPVQLGIAHSAHAEVLSCAGKPAEALAAAVSASDLLSTGGALLLGAQARELVARGLSDTGDLEGARVELGRAKSDYATVGADWLVAQAVRAESRLGATASRPGAGGGDQVLSGREREVAALAGAGLTNRQIAGKLFLSTKTVEAHLARVFTKLDVRSRVELANLLSTGQ